MPSPKQGYFIGNERVPSVTTILGRFKDSGALIKWAHRKGLAGEPLYGEGSSSKLACDVGTAAHDMVECYIRGRQFQEHEYPEDIVKRAKVPYGAFLRWARQCRLKPEKTEIELVSVVHRYGGCLDSVTMREDAETEDGQIAVTVVEGQRRLLDWKTSNAVYSDYILQLAAYGLLWDENFPNDPIQGYDLVRFAKEQGDFAHHSFEDLSLEREQFLLYRQAYENDLTIRKRV